VVPLPSAQHHINQQDAPVLIRCFGTMRDAEAISTRRFDLRVAPNWETMRAEVVLWQKFPLLQSVLSKDATELRPFRM